MNNMDLVESSRCCQPVGPEPPTQKRQGSSAPFTQMGERKQAHGRERKRTVEAESPGE